MKRFDIYGETDERGNPYIETEQCEDGHWVRCEDAEQQLATLRAQLAVTEKALGLASGFIAEDSDICFWNESGKVANGYGGYDCDMCPRYPIEKCTLEWYLQKAKEGTADG